MEEHQSGIRIGPTVQQGGVQTIQQSIYLNHNNPCGINFTLGSGKIGTTGISALELIEYLNLILINETTQELRRKIVAATQLYSVETTEDNFLKFIHACVAYAKSCASIIPDLPQIEGYTYVLSMYDPLGCMIWDSHTPDLNVTKTDGSGNLTWQTVDLIPGCPFGASVEVYQINETPYYLSYVRVSGGTTDDIGKMLLESQFLTNAYAQAENTLSVGSLLIDNQNTRVYIKKQFGIGVRQAQQPVLSNGSKKRGMGYYVNYLSRFNLNQENPRTRSLFDFIFIRLGLEQLY